MKDREHLAQSWLVVGFFFHAHQSLLGSRVWARRAGTQRVNCECLPLGLVRILAVWFQFCFYDFSTTSSLCSSRELSNYRF